MNRSNMTSRLSAIALGIVGLATAGPVVAGPEVTTTLSVYVNPAGPETRNGMNRQFYVEGKSNGEGGKYACFGVLDFPASKLAASDEKPKGMTLYLTQRLAKYSKSGKLKFYLASDSKRDLQALVGSMKFQLAAPNGLGDQFKSKNPLGAGTFTSEGENKVDAFALTFDDTTREIVVGQIRQAGTVRIIVVPDDPDVAATYFGHLENEAASRPRLKIDSASP